VPSIADLQGCATNHLNDFVNPVGRRSFATYDRQGDPALFEPTDALAPALLDAPLKRSEVNLMFTDVLDNPYQELRLAIQHCLAELATLTLQNGYLLDFANADLDEREGPWALVRTCFNACNGTPNVKASKVSKMLHRKQPMFIPVIDSKLVGFYGLTMREPSKYWSTLQSDYRENREFLDNLGQDIRTSENRPISSLRVADIIIWEHKVTGCNGNLSPR
jgi:hypothetical protein